jgi:hypothetical protein
MDWVVMIAVLPLLWPVYLLQWLIAKATGRR